MCGQATAHESSLFGDNNYHFRIHRASSTGRSPNWTLNVRKMLRLIPLLLLVAQWCRADWATGRLAKLCLMIVFIAIADNGQHQSTVRMSSTEVLMSIETKHFIHRNILTGIRVIRLLFWGVSSQFGNHTNIQMGGRDDDDLSNSCN